MMLILALFSLVVYLVKPEAMIAIALVLAFAALPASLHVGKVVGPGVIYSYQVALVLAICYLIPVVRPRFSDFLVPGIFTLAVVFVTVVGFANGHSAWVVIRESQTLLEMVGGFVLGWLVVKGGYLRLATSATVLILWFSAGMAILGSLRAIRLAGRAEDLPAAGAGEALRVILATQTPATAVLTALVAASIIGRVRPALYLALGPPALIIAVLSLSRNPLIAFTVAAAVAFLTSVGWSTLFRTIVVTATSALIVAVTVPGALFLLQGSPAGAWLADQLAAFNYRVLGGVSTSALAVDESALDRLREVEHLNRAIAQAPLFGHGLGYAYQLSYGTDPNDFSTKFYPTFSHNFYLWWLAKAGVAGMAAFALLALTPLRALRRASAPARISASVSAGLLAVSAVWPLPELPVDAMALGLVLGATMAFAAGPRPDRDAGLVDQAPPLTGAPG
ncbi:MAG: O-antigen ligase domain-containing protein [Mycobacterium sp.]|nr:MAG: O-antigen ligase domain-containing protein [Mycobacterium sp.]